jgi:hypothetical protein
LGVVAVKFEIFCAIVDMVEVVEVVGKDTMSKKELGWNGSRYKLWLAQG